MQQQQHMNGQDQEQENEHEEQWEDEQEQEDDLQRTTAPGKRRNPASVQLCNKVYKGRLALEERFIDWTKLHPRTARGALYICAGVQNSPAVMKVVVPGAVQPPADDQLRAITSVLQTFCSGDYRAADMMRIAAVHGQPLRLTEGYSSELINHLSAKGLIPTALCQQIQEEAAAFEMQKMEEQRVRECATKRARVAAGGANGIGWLGRITSSLSPASFLHHADRTHSLSSCAVPERQAETAATTPLGERRPWLGRRRPSRGAQLG
jgi:hypothetical protein